MSTLTALNRRKPGMLSRIIEGSTLFATLALIFLAGFAASTFLGSFDERLLNGVSVWEKPAKFYLSLSLHTATLGWALSLLDKTLREQARFRQSAIIFAIASIGEMIWITLQAARGEASHFNDSSMVAQIMYAFMGVGAVTLTGVTSYLGYQIRKHGEGVLAYGTGTGLFLAGIMTTLVAGYMSQLTGHAIAGDPTDASGLPFFHWSTTGGDLRVAHFAALHIAQAMPFVAWVWPERKVVQISALVCVLIVAALLVQALMGVPFLRA